MLWWVIWYKALYLDLAYLQVRFNCVYNKALEWGHHKPYIYVLESMAKWA